MLRKKISQERRGHLRGNLHFLVKYKTEDGKTGVVSSINVCAGGALLRLRQECLPGQLMNLFINFIGPPKRHISAVVKVLRVNKQKNYYKTAVEFEKISTEDKNAIDAFIHTFFKK